MWYGDVWCSDVWCSVIVICGVLMVVKMIVVC